MIFLGDYDCAFLDHVEGIGVIAFVEDDLPLFVGLGVAGRSEGVFLLLGELAEEGEDLEEFFVLFLVELVDVVHDLLEYATVYLD